MSLCVVHISEIFVGLLVRSRRRMSSLGFVLVYIVGFIELLLCFLSFFFLVI